MERHRFELTYEESRVLWQSNSGCEGHQLDPRIHSYRFSTLKKESSEAGEVLASLATLSETGVASKRVLPLS